MRVYANFGNEPNFVFNSVFVPSFLGFGNEPPGGYMLAARRC